MQSPGPTPLLPDVRTYITFSPIGPGLVILSLHWFCPFLYLSSVRYAPFCLGKTFPSSAREVSRLLSQPLALVERYSCLFGLSFKARVPPCAHFWDGGFLVFLLSPLIFSNLIARVPFALLGQQPQDHLFSYNFSISDGGEFTRFPSLCF